MIRAYPTIFLHLLGSILVSCGLLWAFFYVYLPQITHHKEVVEIPNLQGIHMTDLTDFLTKRDLFFSVSADSDYTTTQSPYTVVKQFPVAGTIVKKYRKLIITLNAAHPPSVKMPNLIDGSVKNAQLRLKVARLQLKHIHYVPDLAQNAVLQVYWQGEPIAAGTPVPQGAEIYLEVGAGIDGRGITIPNVQHIPEKEAESILINSGLRMGKKYYVPSKMEQVKVITRDGDSILREQPYFQAGIVIRQSPPAQKRVQVGTNINLWIATETPQISP